VAANLPVLLEDGQSKYVWGRGLLYATNPAGTAVASVYQRDGLGTVRALTDGAGVLTATREVDEFGLPTRSQGPSAQPFGSPGSSATPRPGWSTCGRGTTTPISGGSSSATRWPGA
jgi:hypothetical protein